MEEETMRPPSILAAGVLWATLSPIATAEEPGQIPNPRPSGWATDLTGRLSDETIEQINAIGEDVSRDLGSQLAVVAIRSTDGRAPRAFATELFNRWGIGRRDEDDGLLILVALEDRKAEIVLGDGIDDPDRVAASRRIMDGTMLPLFRSGDPEQAVLRGARRCAVEILGLEPPSPILPARLPVARGGRERGGHPWGGVLGYALGLLGAAGSWVGLRHHLRYRRRNCPECSSPMTLLDRAEGVAHLAPAERAEHRLGSVSHDVWACSSCDQVLKRPYASMFSKYALCPACSARTLIEIRSTIRGATRSSAGLERIEDRCNHCSYKEVRERALPRLPQPGSSSCGTGSGPSSSAGSGGGFGGGSSSGGGASGGW
jgi:uncharacterized protein